MSLPVLELILSRPAKFVRSKENVLVFELAKILSEYEGFGHALHTEYSGEMLAPQESLQEFAYWRHLIYPSYSCYGLQLQALSFASYRPDILPVQPNDKGTMT